MVDRDAKLVGGGDVPTGAEITTVPLRGHLEHLDEVEPLVVGVVVIVELLGVDQAEVLVAPGEVADRRGDLVEILLEPPVLGVVGEVGELSQSRSTPRSNWSRCLRAISTASATVSSFTCLLGEPSPRCRSPCAGRCRT